MTGGTAVADFATFAASIVDTAQLFTGCQLVRGDVSSSQSLSTTCQHHSPAVTTQSALGTNG